MLVILSDLHLSDGTTSYNPSPQAFGILKEEIDNNTRQNKAQEIRLVLLGDIFDLVRTDWWFDPANVQPKNRPWYDLDRTTGLNNDPAEVQRQFLAVLELIFKDPSAKEFVSMINTLAPDAKGARPKITYVMGNHDRAINNFQGLQDRIRAQFPNLDLEFRNFFSDPAYGVFARHGHEWDENCNARLLLKNVLQPHKQWDYLNPEINKVMAIGEVITAELMSGLVYRVLQTGNQALAEVIKGLDNLRPATDVFQWLQWQVRGRALPDKEKDLLAQVLAQSISGVVDSDLGQLWDNVESDFLVSGDIVDRLQLVKVALEKFGFDGLSGCVKLFLGIGGFKDAIIPEQDDFYTGAKGELKSLPDTTQFVLYGYTHRALHHYVSGSVDNRVKLYINTGTYLPLIEKTDDGKGFSKSHQMTMAFFYRYDEDQQGRAGAGPTMDLWNGMKRKEYA